MFDSVLLPAPFSPSSACTSPAAASKSTASFASTPGKRLVIPRMATAAPCGAAVVSTRSAATRFSSRRRRRRLARRWDVGDGPDYSLDQPLHGVQVLDPEALALRDHQLAALVIERAGELVELPGLDLLLLREDQRLRLRRDRRAERRQLREAVVDRAVVEA